ncbi:phenolic glucoside malonyltransferase 1-like [Telopea speciosissima]|uniref:phenolic glucoside malonyltransferase 1-like n=1 Tax=Telopea speciosissima TaxID=54955 RepID=UPI001CC7C349|nr:phenolic glucoside malonyltransferase 1-like [Telopea speciosissima]
MISVSFTVAESDADFNHLSVNHPKDALESRPLVPPLPTSEYIVPILAIQVTVFPNNGFCIGATHLHSICDGRGFAHFMRTWATISKLGASSLLPESLPFLDKTVIEEHDDEGILKLFLDELDRFMGSGNRRLRVMDIELQPNMVRATFKVNEPSCRRLKDWFLAQYKKDEQITQKQSIPPSTLMVICAYTWICLLKAEAKAGVSKTNNMTRFVFNVDCRVRLDPPIPKTYLGNCVRPCVVIAEKTNLMRGGVVVAAQLIRDVVHEMMDKGILRGMEHSVSELLELESGRILAAAGSPEFGYYKTDFGFGKPKKVEMASNDRTGAMFLKESSNVNVDGGIEFDLVLDRQEMNAFISVFVDGFNAMSYEHSLLWPSAPRSLL